MAEFLIAPVAARVEDRGYLGDPVQAAEQRRNPQVVQRAGHGARVRLAPREVRRQQAQAESRRHGLSVVELGVWWPPRIEDVRLVPVGQVAARCCRGGEHREEAAGGEEGTGGGGARGHDW